MFYIVRRSLTRRKDAMSSGVGAMFDVPLSEVVGYNVILVMSQLCMDAGNGSILALVCSSL